MRPVIHLAVHHGHCIARRLGGGDGVWQACEALAHPRTLMGGFLAVEATFATVIRAVLPGLRLVKADGVVQLVPECDGGYTDVELRAFEEAATMAGLRRARMLARPQPMTDTDIRQVLATPPVMPHSFA